MDIKRELFRKLPKIDQLLLNDEIKNTLNVTSRNIVVETIREEVELLRNEILNERVKNEELEYRIDNIIKPITTKIKKKNSIKLKKVINCTGVVIHTNLGRSLISQSVMENISQLALGYSNLEFDLEKGMRGSRYSHLEDIIVRITGAESAMVVNNNAAAVMLVLSSLAKGREVIVSRGELVEIGGSFRIPEVMEQSNAKLVEVGTTNKTHLRDYIETISEDTAVLMKVHTSNYRILGFTESVDLKQLVEVGKTKGIPVIEDLGSGVLVDLSKYGLAYEPTVQDSILAGVDIVTFSGDKLLGGPQAGIIIGKKKYIDMMKKNPLTRALRVDKFTISALEGTLRLYLDENNVIKDVPTLRMITMPISEIEMKAEVLFDKMSEVVNDRIKIEIVDTMSQVGGGSMPLEEIPSKAIMIYSNELSISRIEKELRNQKIPIIARVYRDNIYLDLRTIQESDFEIIAEEFKNVINEM